MTKEKLKFYVYVPFLLVEKLISLIFGFIYIPFLNFRYGILAMSINSERSISYSNRFKDKELKRIHLKDIKNKKMKFSLFITGLFKKWYIYEKYDTNPVYDEDKHRKCVYLSKEEINQDSLVDYDRISSNELSKKYKHLRKYLKLKGLEKSDFYKIEPQYFVLIGKKPKDYELKRSKISNSYNKKVYKQDTEKIKKCIKNDNINNWISNWEDKTPLEYAVDKNRYDLVDKIVKYSDKLNERNEVLNYQYHRNGEYHYGQITKPIYYTQNKEMFDYLIKLGAEYNEDDYKQIKKNTYSNAQSNIKEFFKI
jgi:hypothetical protein